VVSWDQLRKFLLQHPYAWRRWAVIILGLAPPLICAWSAESSGRWELFERSGSLTAAIGLLVASRRYLEHGIVELASLRLNGTGNADIIEVMEDVVTGKLGPALSAFGTFIWGWGTYLGWWTFGFLSIWAVIAARDAWRDRSHLAGGRMAVRPSKTWG